MAQKLKLNIKMARKPEKLKQSTMEKERRKNGPGLFIIQMKSQE